MTSSPDYRNAETACKAAIDGVSPHPTHNGRMGQRQAAFGHHLHQVSQAQLEAKIPAHAQDDDLAVKVATLEQSLDAHQLAHAHPSGSSRHHSGPDPAVCTRAFTRTVIAIDGSKFKAVNN